jgi:hypothetical protein
MKKNVRLAIGSIACGMSLLFAGQIMAATDGVITTVVGAIGGGTGPALEVKLSPNVNLGYSVETTAGLSFAINSENSTIDFNSGNRNEYAIASDYSGYYQQPSATEAGLAKPTAANSSAFNDKASYVKM